MTEVDVYLIVVCFAVPYHHSRFNSHFQVYLAELVVSQRFQRKLEDVTELLMWYFLTDGCGFFS